MALIYCPQQLDAICAAAIITRHANLSRKTIKFGGYLRYETLTEQLKNLPQTSLFILDICSQKEHAPFVGNVAYWSTHDPSAHPLRVRIYDHTTERACAAQLAMKRFLPTDNIAQRLAQIAHDHTYWQHGHEAQQLADIVSAGYPAQDLINTLAKGIIWSNKFEAAYREYQHKKQEGLEKIHKSLVVKRYLRHNVGYAYCPHIIASADAGHYLITRHNALDIVILIYATGKIILRRNDQCVLDMNEIAKILDGGGQPYAAGAHVPKQSFSSTIEHIDKKIKQYFTYNSNV